MVMDVTRQREIFSNNLKRHMVGRNQNDVAAYIGVSPQTFNTWYKGKSVPRADKLQKLADYFWVKPSDLLEENEWNQEDDIEEEVKKKYTAVEAIKDKIGMLNDDNQIIIGDLIDSLLKVQKRKGFTPAEPSSGRLGIIKDKDGNLQKVVILDPKTEK